jgi:hypothetical protein
MKREKLYLEALRFTTMSECAREVLAIIRDTEYKVVVLATEDQIERLAAELDGQKTLSRLDVEEIAA